MDVKTLCLGVLATGERSGYEINKTLEDRFRHFFRASYGSIYPALAALEQAGMVDVEPVRQPRRPAKKVYRLTDAGRRALRDALAQEEPSHVVRSEFLVLMYFAHLLPRDRLDHVIEQQTADFERIMWSDLEAFEREQHALTPGQRFALGYARTVLTAALGFLKRQRVELLRDVAAAEGQPIDERRARLLAAGD